MDDLSHIKEQLLQKTQDLKEGVASYKEAKSNRNMGIGDLGDPSTVFVREFRWTLGGKNLSESFMKKVVFDYVKKQIYVEAYEVVLPSDSDIGLHKWLDGDIGKETLVFTTFDGCGGPLYEYRISDLELLSDMAQFDYASSEVTTRKFTLRYKNLERKFLAAKEKPETFRKKGFDFTIGIHGSLLTSKVKVGMRPTLDIEETEINFLSAKTWIPGKCSWEKITVVVDKHEDMKFLSALLANEYPTLSLVTKERYTDRSLEMWELHECKLDSIKSLPSEKHGDPDNKYEIVIAYSFGGIQINGETQ